MSEQTRMTVHVIRSRRKTIGLTFERDGSITARIPLVMKDAALQRFLEENRATIDRHCHAVQANLRAAEAAGYFTEAMLQAMAEKAKEVIPPRVAYYAEKLGVTYGRITIRRQKSRWGSCSAKGNLNFNCLLMETPPQVLDAIIVHELCHRKHMNHSAAFYAEVRRVYPAYDKWNTWLKANGAILMNRAAL